MARATTQQTPFEILGVSVRDDHATIRAAWKKLVRENHPDRCPADAARLTAKLVQLNTAYDKLKNHVPLRTRPAAPDFAAEQRAEARRKAEAEAAAREAADRANRERAAALAAREDAARQAARRAAAAAAEAARRAAEVASRKANPLSAAQREALASATRAFAATRAALDGRPQQGFARAA